MLIKLRIKSLINSSYARMSFRRSAQIMPNGISIPFVTIVICAKCQSFDVINWLIAIWHKYRRTEQRSLFLSTKSRRIYINQKISFNQISGKIIQKSSPFRLGLAKPRQAGRVGWGFHQVMSIDRQEVMRQCSIKNQVSGIRHQVSVPIN